MSLTKWGMGQEPEFRKVAEVHIEENPKSAITGRVGYITRDTGRGLWFYFTKRNDERGHRWHKYEGYGVTTQIIDWLKKADGFKIALLVKPDYNVYEIDIDEAVSVSKDEERQMVIRPEDAYNDWKEDIGRLLDSNTPKLFKADKMQQLEELVEDYSYISLKKIR